MPYRWLVLALTALAGAGALFSTGGLRLEEDISAMLPSRDPALAPYQTLLAHFNPMNTLFAVVSAEEKDTGSPDFLVQSADSLADLMRRSPYFTKISYRWEYGALDRTQRLMRRFMPNLCTEEDLAALLAKTSYDSIYFRLHTWKKTLMESPAPFLTRAFLEDPLGFDTPMMQKLAAASSAGSGVTVHQGRLMSTDLRHALIIAVPAIPATDSRQSARFVAFMDSAVHVVRLRAPEPVRIAYISGHRFANENSRRIKKDIGFTMSLSLVAISLITLLFFSRPLLVLLTLVPALFGALVALGCMRWISPDLSAIALGSGSFLVGITVDISTHLLFHIDREKNGGGLRAKALLRGSLRLPLLLGAGTTIAAFLTLMASSLPGYRQLSAFAMLGVCGSLAFVFITLPFLIPEPGKKRRDAPVTPAPALEKLLRGASARRIPVVLAVGAVSVLLLPGFLRLRLDGDLQKLNAVSTSVAGDWQRVQDTFKDAIGSTSIALFADDETALELNEALAGKLDTLQQEGLIQSYQSVQPFYPSRKMQEIRIQAWEAVFTPIFMDTLEQRIGRAAVALRMRPESFIPFLTTLAMKRPLLTRPDFAGTLFEEMLSARSSKNGKGVVLLTSVRLPSSDVPQLDSRLAGFSGKIILYNGARFSRQITETILKELKKIGILAFLTSILFLVAVTRNVRRILLLSLPLLVSLYWTFGIMGWLGLSLNLISSMVSVFIFGIVVDYCIFLYAACTGSEGASFIHTSASAIVVSALTTLAGLGSLIAAGHPVLRALGLTAVLGISCGILAVFSLIPAFFYRHSEKA